MQRIWMIWYLLTLIKHNDMPFGTYWRNIPFYFVGSWESYLVNQFISNLLIPMPNHIMESHIKSQTMWDWSPSQNKQFWMGHTRLAIPKKNKQIQFATNFWMLNQFLCWYLFPLPSIQEIMCTIDGLTFVSILDLNMGFWMILLDIECQWLATVILPWGKYSYQCLAMGLSVSPDIYQGIMSAIFSDMEDVICFIDNIALIMNKSFENHLKQLDEILHQLEDNNLQVNGNKSSFCAIEAEFLEFVLTR